MYKLFILFFIQLQLGLAAYAVNASSPNSPPEVRKGILDLKKWTFAGNGPLALNGQWEFYWQMLLTPGDFSNPKLSRLPSYINLPRSWNGYKLNGQALPGPGYATFRLQIILPGPEKLALKMGSMGTAYQMFANGVMVCANGRVGTQKSASIPQFLPRTVSLGAISGKLELILQVSNFYHKKGGAWNPIVLGSEEQIFSLRERNLLIEIFLYGALLIMGLYHVILYLFRRKELSALYFGIYCFLIALRTLVKGERFLNELFPHENFELLFKLEVLSFYLAVPVFVNFVSLVFPGVFHRKAVRIINIISLLFCSLVLVTSSMIYSYSVPFFQIFTMLAIVFTLVNIFRALFRKMKGAFLFLCGTLFLFITVINDILYNQKIIDTGNLVSFGLLIFIFFQAVILSRRFADGMNISEELSKKLEEKVKERTTKLELANVHLSTAINDSSLLVSDIGHKLYNELWPLSQLTTLGREILDDLSSGKQNIEREKLEFLESVILKSEESFERIETLKEKIRENFGKQAIKKDVSLQEFVAETLARIKQIISRSDIILEEKVEIAGREIFLNMNEDQVFTALENIFNNSIQALAQPSFKAHKKILFTCRILNDQVQFSIEDNAQGIPDHLKENIFNMFFSTKDNDGAGGLGMGLPLSKWIIENCHKGSLSVESRPGEFTKFNIFLPVEAAIT
jgi:signal transduction histidine kinase